MRTALLAALLAASAPSRAALITGTDYAGANLSPVNGDILSGTFTNVGLFTLPAGATVFVANGIPLSVYASTISILGTLDGNGRGQSGGAGGGPSLAGSVGFGGGPAGTGFGSAGAAARGGGGGAYGGTGGTGAGTGGGAGGAVYDSTGVYTTPISADDVFQGSGGGGGGGGTIDGGSGGYGGAAVYLEASSLTVTGALLAQGANAAAVINAATNPAAGGGGSGGGIVLRALVALKLQGSLLSARGGAGGSVADEAFCNSAAPGGGGGGGRVKAFGGSSAITGVTFSTAAGAAGTSGCSPFQNGVAPAAGAAGTVSFGALPAAPSALAVETVYATSISWTWAAAASFGDAPAASRAYRIYPSTSTAPLGAPELTVSALNVGATTTGLTPNTTYSRFVTAYSDWGNGAPSNAVSTHTLAVAPIAAAASFSGMSSSGLTFSWNGGANPAYTSYEINAALDAAFSAGVSTSFVVGASSSPSGLAPNTTYWLRVRAVNLDGVPSAYTAAIATSTLAAAPATPAVGTVYVTSAAFSWTAGVNPAGTRYRAEVSGDNFFTVLGASATLGTSATFFGLTPGDQYFFRAVALNHNSVESAFSASVSTRAGNLADVTAPSAPGTPAGDRQFSYDGTVMFAWTPSSSGVGILDYQLLLGSTPGGNDVFNGTVGVASYTAVGLATGKSYFAQVRARSNAGIVGPFSSVSVGVPVFVAAQAPAISAPKAWPNPASLNDGPVQIGFFLEKPAEVVMRVYTLQGRLIRETSSRYDAGNQVGSWDGNGFGGKVAPGGYVVEIRKSYGGGRVESQRVKVAVIR